MELDLPWLNPERPDTYILGNLLAILNRDGGHYQADHGREAAVRDALERYYGLVEQVEDQQKQIEELEAALRDAIDEGGLYLSGKGDKVGSFRDHGFRRADEVPHLAAWLKKQEEKE